MGTSHSGVEQVGPGEVWGQEPPCQKPGRLCRGHAGDVVAAGWGGAAGGRNRLGVIQSNFAPNSPSFPGRTGANWGGGRREEAAGAIPRALPSIRTRQGFLWLRSPHGHHRGPGSFPLTP